MKAFGSIFLLMTILLFTSCEKTIHFRLNETTPKLVVEATIENGQPPMVVLSQSIDFFSKINPSILENSFVHNADVYISNGALTHKLKEYANNFASGYDLYYYSIDSSDLATAFNGELGKKYSLKIVVNGKGYTATTTIPVIMDKLDSVYWKQAPQGISSNKVSLMATITDPPGFGDYIRYFTKANHEFFYPGINSVFDDQVTDGTTFSFQFDRGIPRYLADKNDSLVYFNKGDTVTLKICNIDRATFEFWRTMEFSYSSISSPFSTPTKVRSNILPDGLGYFGGYAAQSKTIVIPK